jgi:hypothetical protein
MTRKVTFHTSPSVTVGLLCHKLYTVVRGSTNFSKIYKLIPNSSRKNYGTKQVPNWGPAITEWPVNFTVIWPFLLGARKLTDILLCKGKNHNNYAENKTRHYTQFRRLGLVHPCCILRAEGMWRFIEWSVPDVLGQSSNLIFKRRLCNEDSFKDETITLFRKIGLQKHSYTVP